MPDDMERKDVSDTQDDIALQDKEDAQQDTSDVDNRLGMSMLAKVTLGIVIVVSLIISISCLMQFNQNQQAIEDLKQEVKQRNEYIKKIQAILNSEGDDAQYIIEQAKEQFGYYFPDDKVIHQDIND